MAEWRRIVASVALSEKAKSSYITVWIFGPVTKTEAIGAFVQVRVLPHPTGGKALVLRQIGANKARPAEPPTLNRAVVGRGDYFPPRPERRNSETY